MRSGALIAEVTLSYALLSGTPLPPELDANLAPLGALLAYAALDGSVTHFAAFLQIH